MARSPARPGDRARWGPSPIHVDPEVGDTWIDADTGRTWVFTEDE